MVTLYENPQKSLIISLLLFGLQNSKSKSESVEIIETFWNIFKHCGQLVISLAKYAFNFPPKNRLSFKPPWVISTRVGGGEELELWSSKVEIEIFSCVALNTFNSLFQILAH